MISLEHSMQGDDVMVILVTDSQHLLVRLDLDPPLFLDFPLQTGPKRFTGFLFFSGKFPAAFHVRPFGAFGDQKMVVFSDQGGGDVDVGFLMIYSGNHQG